MPFRCGAGADKKPQSLPRVPACADCPFLTETTACTLLPPVSAARLMGARGFATHVPHGSLAPQGSPQNTRSQPACLLSCVLGILRKAVLTFPTRHQPKGALWSSKEQRPVPCAGKAVNYVALPWQTRQQSHGGLPAGGLSCPTTDSLPEHPLWASLGYTVSQSPDHSLTLLPKSKCLFYPRRMMSVAQ